MMSLKPIGNRALVRMDAEETMTSSGIYLPDQAKEKPRTAVVIAVGPGYVHPRERSYITPMDQGIQVGDRVLLNSAYAGAASQTEGEVLVDLSEVLAVLS